MDPLAQAVRTKAPIERMGNSMLPNVAMVIIMAPLHGPWDPKYFMFVPSDRKKSYRIATYRIKLYVSHPVNGTVKFNEEN